MGVPLAGPGQGLPLAQNLYPSELYNAPYDSPTNRINLAPGQAMAVPAGTWYINLGGYLIIQYLDPITGAWTVGSTGGQRSGQVYVKSDGFTCRVANMTGCVLGAYISSGGSAYVQASTTITVTGSSALMTPIVGGQQATLSIVNAGAGYGVAPIVLLPAPQPAQTNQNGIGGIAAAGYATIASGTVSGFTFTNPGAGYAAAVPNQACLPSPFDPNLSTGITLGTLSFSLAGSGSITGVITTNNGAPITPANVTLTVGGAGVTATLNAVVMQTITAATVLNPGVGYGLGAGAVLAVGGVPGTGTITNNPDALYLAWFPRAVNIGLTPTNTSVSAGTAGVVYDGGLFLGAPTSVWVSAGTVGTITTIGNVAFVMGSRSDIATLQPAP